RVYYSYAVRMITKPVVTHAVVLVLAVVILARLVHVAAVYRNLVNVQVGELGAYVLRAIIHTDMATLVTLALIIVAMMSLQRRIGLFRFRMIHTT
ncbi:MAG: hypothetical protein ACI92I_000812, partial [Acidimicrobiales bacterium]